MTNDPTMALLFIVLCAFAFFFYGPWQTLCVAWSRQKMFESRERLFQVAEAGGWSFDADEYRRVRRFIELNIRFAHRISWPSLLMLSVARKAFVYERPHRIHDVVNRIQDERIRDAVKQELTKVTRATLLLFIHRSLILLTIAGLGWLWYRYLDSLHSCVRHVGGIVSGNIEIDAQLTENGPVRRRYFAPHPTQLRY